MRFEEFVDIALILPDTEETLGEVKRDGRMMFSRKGESDFVAVKMNAENRARFGQQSGDDHLPWITVDLSQMDDELARQIIAASYEDAPNVAARRQP